jgi:hypothetical protein
VISDARKRVPRSEPANRMAEDTRTGSPLSIPDIARDDTALGRSWRMRPGVIDITYSEAGERIPHGDQYTIDGFDRALVKVAVNTLLNAPTTNSAILAITEELRYNPDLRAVNGIESSNRSPCRALAERVVAAIHDKHRQIKRYFGSDCGPRFQRQDSDMAIEIMTRMIERTGRCPLPVHDSFLVPEIDADILSQTMVEVAREYGLELDLKDSRGRATPAPPTGGRGNLSPSPPFQLGVTTADLRGSSRQIWLNSVSCTPPKAVVDTPGTEKWMKLMTSRTRAVPAGLGPICTNQGPSHTAGLVGPEHYREVVNRDDAEGLQYHVLPTDDPVRALNILREAAGLQPLSDEPDDQGGDDRGGIG